MNRLYDILLFSENSFPYFNYTIAFPFISYWLSMSFKVQYVFIDIHLDCTNLKIYRVDSLYSEKGKTVLPCIHLGIRYMRCYD